MSTLKELRMKARQQKIKGRSKMNKSQLISALTQLGKTSRKPKRKASRKPKRKASRKPKRKTSRKPKRKTSRKPKRKTSRKPKRKASRKPKRKTSRKPNINANYNSIIMNYIKGNDKALNTLTVKHRNEVLHAVKFHGTKFGRVEYFKKQLNKHLGTKWSNRVLDKTDDLSDVPSVKRLGVPGRQGTTIQLYCDGKYYAVKVARKGTSCGDGATGGMGFLKQARMQELASKHGVTCSVDAVYCGHKNDISFMVMPVFKDRFTDRYPKRSTVSLKHQKQLWNLYLKLDSHVGIIHNDLNCLNVMIDFKDNVKLIDFDRSSVIEKKHIKKWGCYPNLYFITLLNCFRAYGINPGSWLGSKINEMKVKKERRYIIKPATI